ncbi:hypothetical protein NE237_017610 [Protea cynaroides]|uniref:Uncharacterized protein n=1 Tax=Protea cynaroides TaxID=273540 RepID=A0A9Q0K8G5_9MAGN|nr:hypothetical protein NE237_017610 [Protea cynaroides]
MVPSSPSRKPLVSSCKSNESLFWCLHSNCRLDRTPVNWTTRLKITEDLACDLEIIKLIWFEAEELQAGMEERKWIVRSRKRAGADGDDSLIDSVEIYDGELYGAEVSRAYPYRPFIMTSMPPSMLTGLALILGIKAHYSILKQHAMVHLDDMCNAHSFLLEYPKAEGRYTCSTIKDTTIFELANLFRKRYLEYIIPTTFKGINESIKPFLFSSKKPTELGFKYKSTVVDMFDGGLQRAASFGNNGSSNPTRCQSEVRFREGRRT